MHLRDEFRQFGDIRTCYIVNAIIAFTAIAKDNTPVKTAVSREVEIHPWHDFLVYMLMIVLSLWHCYHFRLSSFLEVI
jgi:hypothetical protein